MMMSVIKCKHGEFNNDSDINGYPKLGEPITMDVDVYRFFYNDHLNIQAGVALKLRQNQSLVRWRHQILTWLGENGYNIFSENGKMRSKYRNNKFNTSVSISYDKHLGDKIVLEERGPEEFIYRRNLVRHQPITFDTLTFDTVVINENNVNWGDQYK